MPQTWILWGEYVWNGTNLGFFPVKNIIMDPSIDLDLVRALQYAAMLLP